MPNLVELVALAWRELQLWMLVHHFVQHTSVQLIGIEPGQVSTTHELQPLKHGEAPHVGELRRVQLDALRLSDCRDFVANRVVPIEDGAAHVPRERLHRA